MTLLLHYVNYDHYLSAPPDQDRVAYHRDGETFDRFQVVAGQGIYVVRHTWDRSRALWKLTYRLLPSEDWQQDDGPRGWRFACLSHWHSDCALTTGLEDGKYDDLHTAETAWQTWLSHERSEIALREQRLTDLSDGVTP